ncbi:MAG: nucleotidyltransferase family protein [Myxococcota bacterium]
MRALGGIIVAGGHSRRMGTDKALISVGGQPIVERLIAAFLEAHLSPVIVVGSHAVRTQVPPRDGLRLVPSDPDQPMIDSICRGIQALPSDVSGVVLQPVDAALTTPEMIAALTQGARHAARILCHRGAPGHPVLIPRSAFPEILERPEGGLRALLATLEVELVEWPDPAILADLDTPEDLARLIHGLH